MILTKRKGSLFEILTAAKKGFKEGYDAEKAKQKELLTKKKSIQTVDDNSKKS